MSDRIPFRYWVVFGVCGLALACIFGLSLQQRLTPRRTTSESAPASSEGRTVTIDARDEGGQLIDPINVWNDYQARSAVVARVHHGDSVTMLSRNGNGVEIQTAIGARGWLTYSFIKELK